MSKEVISSETIICPNLNEGRRRRLLHALVKTYRDGTTEALCTKKGQNGFCQATNKPCNFEPHCDASQTNGEATPSPEADSRSIFEDYLVLRQLTDMDLQTKNLKDFTQAIELLLIRFVLTKSDGDAFEATRLLGIPYRTFLNKCAHHRENLANLFPTDQGLLKGEKKKSAIETP